ncbi:hypothetical protein V3Q90_09000 [Flavobacterium oreochromis]|uniref:phosphoribosyltransferase-like protein n=1 Tax=Flavobacterium oreochromis TaxID=2906078 RepID=UPI0038581FF3
MEDKAQEIFEIIRDYHCDRGLGFVMSQGHILNWVNQFDANDREFIITELLHLLQKGIYVSRTKAKEILRDFIIKATKHYGYNDPHSFLTESVFLDLQGEGKSQKILIGLLNEVLNEEYGFGLEICGTIMERNYIYIDDVIATGKTFLKNMRDWLDANDGEKLKAFKKGQINIVAYYLCKHSWAVANVKTSLKMTFSCNDFLNSKKFMIVGRYLIENNLTEFNEKLNLVYPVESNSEILINYINSNPEASVNRNRAFRKPNQPGEENFFSSNENRQRFETIFLQKGIELIEKIPSEEKRKMHRPLGKTYPHYNTFGTGTLFFSWNNISNTCPVVLWWDVPAHNWFSLFPLFNRGN